MRQTYRGLHKRGSDMSLDSMRKIAKYYDRVHFCGQLGDPIYHPKFIDMLEIAKDIEVDISTAGQGKTIDWFEQAAFVSAKQRWIFGLDGLPHESHKYRVNQDGERVFECMKHLSSLGANVAWQYIVFKYNQDSIEEAAQLARENNITFGLIESSRWDEPYDKYKPDFRYKDRPRMSV